MNELALFAGAANVLQKWLPMSQELQKSAGE